MVKAKHSYRIVQAVCCACENKARDSSLKPCVDLGAHRRIVGFARAVRFLCETHTRGFVMHSAFEQGGA